MIDVSIGNVEGDMGPLTQAHTEPLKQLGVQNGVSFPEIGQGMVTPILFQSEKYKIRLQSFVIVFVCAATPILSILP